MLNGFGNLYVVSANANLLSYTPSKPSYLYVLKYRLSKTLTESIGSVKLRFREQTVETLAELFTLVGGWDH